MKTSYIQTAITLVLILLCIWNTGCGIPSEKFSETKEFTQDGNGIETIDAKTTNGHISLIACATDQIYVHARKDVYAFTMEEAEAFAEKVEILVKKDGDTLRIYKEQPKNTIGINVNVHFDITCPQNVQVNLGSTNGKVESKGVEGAVTASSTNGAVEVDGGSKQISLKTTNGSVNFKNITGAIKASSTNGAVKGTIETLTDTAQLSTTNGSIDVSVEEGVAPIKAGTTNGSLSITLPEDYSGHLDAKTSNGRIHSDFDVQFEGKKKNRVDGPIGAGGETELSLHTTNGNINIKKQ